MRQNFPDLSDTQVVKLFAQILHILNLNGGHSQIVSQFFQIHIVRDLNIIFHPIQ